MLERFRSRKQDRKNLKKALEEILRVPYLCRSVQTKAILCHCNKGQGGRFSGINLLGQNPIIVD